MKKNKLLVTIGVFTLLLGGAFSLSNCDNNTEEQIQDVSSLNAATVKEWYNSKFKKSAEWKENSENENIIPDWKNVTFRKLDGLEVVEFPLVQKDIKINTLDTKKLNPTLLKIAFIKTVTDSIIVRKFYYVPETNYLNSKPHNKNHIDLGMYNNYFRGLLITKKWNNEILSYKNIRNKTIVELTIPKDLDNTGKTSKSTSGVPTAEDPSWFIELNSVTIVGGQRRYYYYFNPFTGKTDLYKDSYFNTNTYQYNGYYYPLTSGTTVATAITTAQSIENNITTVNLDPCVYSVLTKLKSTANFDIANIFTAFGASTKMNIKIVSGVPRNIGDIADTYRTDPKKAFEYTITVTKDYTDGTQLFKATVLLHELVHAYFMSLKDNYSIDHEFGVFQDYPVLFQAWVSKTYPGSSFDAEHEEMANTYVNIMGSALQEFQTGNPVPSGIPDQIYKDLAWGGLKKAPIFDKKFPIGSAERMRIESVFGAESRGGYTGGYYPIGKKCN